MARQPSPAPTSSPLSSAPPSPSPTRSPRRILDIAPKPLATLADLFADDDDESPKPEPEPEPDTDARELAMQDLIALYGHVLALNSQTRDLQAALALLDFANDASATGFEAVWRRARLGWCAEELLPAARSSAVRSTSAKAAALRRREIKKREEAERRRERGRGW